MACETSSQTRSRKSGPNEEDICVPCAYEDDRKQNSSWGSGYPSLFSVALAKYLKPGAL